MRKFIFATFLSFGLFFAVTKSTDASEGFFELKNQVGEGAICHVTSGIMANQQFQILTLCRDILYPGGTEVYQYVVWATPTDGDDPIRLGTLDLGKQLFKTKTPFNSMFVTKELDDRPKSPTGTVIMRGNLQSIEFLSSRGAVVENPVDNELVEQSPEPTATSQSESADEDSQDSGTSRNVFRLIALAGMLGFLAVFGVVLIIFVVTRR